MTSKENLMQKFMNRRIETQCKGCGKSRMLSPFEAKEDGWIMSTKHHGMICAQCAPLYGVPAEFLGLPACALDLGNGGTQIKFTQHPITK